MSSKNQTSDAKQVGPGTKVKGLTPRESGVKLGVSGGVSGENATPGNRNKPVR
jgi:hypothetical protein